MASNWDQDLPYLQLDKVRIHASSLTEAWKDMSTKYLVRSVLVTSDWAMEEMPFDYETARCTVQDPYDAFAATYGLAWIQDGRTGIAWLHPTELAYDSILAVRVQVVRDHHGLPMQSGILEPLGANSTTDIIVKQWDSAFRNTFDFAVNVPAGAYTVRNILNLCCVANPTKTFIARVGDGGVFVTAVNIVPDQMHSVPGGVLHFWDVEMRQERGEGAPTAEQVMGMLAHQEAEVRCAARNYLEAIIWSAQVDEWVTRSASIEQLLWMCIGITSVLVRFEGVTHQVSIETMKQRATDDFLAECEPGLAVMTALNLTRLTKNTRAFEVVKKTKIQGKRACGSDFRCVPYYSVIKLCSQGVAG